MEIPRKLQSKNFYFCKKASNIDMRELIYHKIKNCSWKNCICWFVILYSTNKIKAEKPVSYTCFWLQTHGLLDVFIFLFEHHQKSHQRVDR